MKFLLAAVALIFTFTAFSQNQYNHYKDNRKDPHEPSPGHSQKYHSENSTKSPLIAEETEESEDEEAEESIISTDGESDVDWQVNDAYDGLYNFDLKKCPSKDSLSKLKAVLVVGDVEGSTQSFIAEKKSIAEFLRSLGIQVFEFYSPQDKWENIVKASAGAHIFLYSGHGCITGNIPAGFWLTEGNITSYEISQKLKLHKNALVIFNHVCFGAGSSASDESDIGIEEAAKRVAIYSHPFVDLGAGCYYANNYDGSINIFLKQFFNRAKMHDIYVTEGNRWSKVERMGKYSYNQNYEIGVSVTPADPSRKITQITTINGKETVKYLEDFNQYDVAYVGRPGYTVIDLFK